MSCLNNAKRYKHFIERVSSVVACWTHTHGIMSSNAAEVNLSFHAAGMLFYNMQRNTAPKFYIIRKSITIHDCTILLQVAPKLTTPHKSVRTPRLCYKLHEIEIKILGRP